MNIQISNNYIEPSELDYEVVERKGIGHPDSIADAIAERISVDYSKYCIENFGIVLHHNLDKVAVLGGLSEMTFGHGKLVHPYRIYTNGRASMSFGDKIIPFEDIAKKAIYSQIKQILPDINPETDLQINYTTTDYSKNQFWFHPRDRNDLPEYTFRFANDTSTIISFNDYSPLEKIVLLTESSLYKQEGSNFEQIFNFMGNDIKIMGIRKGNKVNLTACVPLKSKYVSDPTVLKDYYEKIENHILQKISPICKLHNYDLSFNLNTSNKFQNDYQVLLKNYIVNIGSCLDFGEEGLVGRGNNRLGIIPVMRPYSMEAACGKNPYYHVGKVVGVLADQISNRLYNELKIPNIISLTCRHSDDIFDPFILCNFKNDFVMNEVETIIKNVIANQDITNEIVFKEALIPKLYF